MNDIFHSMNLICLKQQGYSYIVHNACYNHKNQQ